MLKRKLEIAMLGAALVAAAAGCGGKKKKSGEGGDGPGTSSPKPTQAALQPAPIGKFKVTGSVTFAGPAKEETTHASQDSATCGDDVLVPGSVRVAGGKLLDVALWLEGTPKGSDPAGGKLVINQKKCGYHPWVATATVGGTMEIKNGDPVMHNVHGYRDDSTLFNESTTGGDSTKQELDEVGDVLLKCDVHPWMESHIKVLDHPYHGETADDGSFSLPAPPPGDYELVAWHLKLGEKRVKVTVPAEGDAKIDVAY